MRFIDGRQATTATCGPESGGDLTFAFNDDEVSLDRAGVSEITGTCQARWPFFRSCLSIRSGQV